MTRIFNLIIVAGVATVAMSCNNGATGNLESQIDSLYDKMSQEERIAQLHGIYMNDFFDAAGNLDTAKCALELPNGVGHISQFALNAHVGPNEVRDMVLKMQNWLVNNTPSGIPALFHEEVLSGVNGRDATVYPQQIGLACSFNTELAELKTNVKSLRGEADKLKSNVRRLREDRIAAFSGEILAQGVVEDAKQLTDAKIDELMLMLAAQCREMLAQRFKQDVSTIPEPEISRESEDRVRKELKNSKGRYLVRLAAVSNAVYGEPVATEASVYSTKQIYKKGELLSKVKFSGTETRAEIDTKIYNALRSVNQKAVRDGILRDPISGNVGSVESAELSNSSKKIKDEQTPCTLEMRTTRDIYTEGPVTLTLSVK